jgi:tRNA(Ile)-lysidine synthase
MINEIKDTLTKYSMLKRGVRVLLCVSGGPDSVAMLYLFKAIAARMKLKLFLAHVNHTLRAEESDRDQSYVEALGNRQKIPVFIKRQDTRKFAIKNRLSIEDSARRLRYKFFREVADELDIDVIATAHTKDDQAETVLMRLLRGTGLKGLRGIPAKSNLGRALLIRPMIGISRKEIEAYLKRKKVRSRTDVSNSDTQFFRNRIRLNLIPLIEKDYSPRIKNLLLTLADLLDKDYEYLELKHEEDFKGVFRRDSKGAIVLHLPGFKKLHPSVKRGVVRKIMQVLCNGLEGIDYRHWKEIESLIDARPVGSILCLPHKITVEKSRRSIRFNPADIKTPRRREVACVIAKVPGLTRFGRRMFRIRHVKCIPGFSKKLKNIEYFDAEKINFPLMIRTSKQGDRMKPLGMKGYKKVSDIFIDEKIPFKRRGSIPLIVSAKGEILWLCGIRISDVCRVGSGTKKTLRLELLTR